MLYEPVSRKMRAAMYRRNANECERGGFTLFAEVNREMAALLDPPPREDVTRLGGDGAGSNQRRPNRRH